MIKTAHFVSLHKPNILQYAVVHAVNHFDASAEVNI